MENQHKENSSADLIEAISLVLTFVGCLPPLQKPRRCMAFVWPRIQMTNSFLLIASPWVIPKAVTMEKKQQKPIKTPSVFPVSTREAVS